MKVKSTGDNLIVSYSKIKLRLFCSNDDTIYPNRATVRTNGGLDNEDETSSSSCRSKNIRRQTRHFCRTCLYQSGLCYPECFDLYHTNLPDSSNQF